MRPGVVPPSGRLASKSIVAAPSHSPGDITPSMVAVPYALSDPDGIAVRASSDANGNAASIRAIARRGITAPPAGTQRQRAPLARPQPGPRAPLRTRGADALSLRRRLPSLPEPLRKPEPS